MIGKSFGNFTILEQIGAGAMGIVYRAYDERLERDVAIKVLPPHRLDDETDRKNFRREALALSKLNHPNVASIYEFRSENGLDFLVMELIRGVTLNERLERGPIEQPELLRLALQMVEGISAAHEQGLIHRDLKPANLRMTEDGRLKILDFGLARVFKTSAAAATLSLGGADGVVGTVPYMAPEQLRTGETDARSDLYSAGAVLYEMATGTRPFRQSGSQLIASILNEVPVRPSSIRHNVSPGLESIILKSLDKDPGRRYQTARELLVDLQHQVSPSSAQSHVVAAKRSRLAPVLTLAALVVIAGVGLIFWPRNRHHIPAAPLRIEQLTNFTDATLWPSLSPDGKVLAFVRRNSLTGGNGAASAAQIYVKMLPDGEPVQITNDNYSKGPLAFSPEGTRIAYTVIDKGFSWDTWTIPVLGGEVRPLIKNASGMSWASDGKLVYSEMDHGLHMRIVTSRESGTDLRQIYSPEKTSGMAHRSAVSPDGKWLLLAEMDETGWLPCRVVPFDGSNSGHRVGPPNGQCLTAAWSPDGRWMYMQSNAGGVYHIWRQPFPDGTPEQLTSGPTEEHGIAVSPDGKSIITAMGTEDSTLWIHSPSGERQVTSEGFTQLPVFSPTQDKLYFLQRSGDNPGFVTGELWAIDLKTLSRAQVVHGFQLSHFSISANGKYVAFTVEEPADQGGIWIAPLEGRSPPRRLSSNGEDRVFFLHNGDILTLGWEGKDRHLFRISSDGTRQKLLEDPLVYLLAVSPDDKWVIATAPLEGSEAGTVVTKAFSLTDKSSRIICSLCAPGGADARRDAPVVSWSGDGKMFYVSYQYFAEMGNRFYTVAVPLRKNETIPALPEQGISSSADLLKLPGGVRIEERNVFPGTDPRHYAMRRVLEKKNLFRLVLTQ